MAAMKTMMVHVLDCNASMTGSLTSPETLPKISVAKAAIGSFLLQRMLASKTIEFGLLKFGGDDEGVSFVEEVVPVARPPMSVFETIQEVETSNLPGDIFEAIDAAHNVVMETNQGKKYNRVIVFFSDGESPITFDSETDELTSQLVRDDCILFMILLVHNSDTDRLSSNINSFRKFANDAKGHMLVTNDLSGIMKFLSSGPGMGTRPTQNKIVFELSPDFKIPCVYSGKTAKVALPSLKKQSNVSYDPDIPDSGKVSLSTVYRNPADPDEELQFEERVKGYRYGPQFIPFGGMDDNILKLASPPIIKLLGFLPAAKVQRQQFLDGCYVLGTNYSTPEGAGARKVLASLGKSMKKLGQVALARFVKRENSDPWLVALIPPETSDDLGEYSDGSLVLHRLPCAEDIRNFLFPPLSASTLSGEQKGSIINAVDSMTFKAHLGPGGLLMYNPALLALLSAIQQKVTTATDPHLMGISNFDGTFKSLGDTPASSSVWKGVREHFPLAPCKNSDRSNRKRKVYWADVEITSSNEAALADIKVETEKKPTVLPPLNESSVQPVDDFALILESYRQVDGSEKPHARAVVRQSLVTLQRIVELLVTTGGTNAHFRKAVGCLKAMREGAIEVGEHELYNDNMMKLKATYKIGRLSKFWENICNESVTLISAEDTTFPCAVTRREADEYLTAGPVTPVAVVVETAPKAQEEDDDLFGEMM